MAPANDNLKPLLLIADIPPVMATIPNIPRIIPIIINQLRTAATSNSAPKGEPGNLGKMGVRAFSFLLILWWAVEDLNL